MISGVKLIALTRHVDDRGYLMEILRSDADHFQRFGQAYVTTCEVQPSGPVVKAWHRHEKQTDHFCCLVGKARVGLYDDREGSPTRGETMSVILGGGRDCLLVIPPGSGRLPFFAVLSPPFQASRSRGQLLGILRQAVDDRCHNDR